MKKIIPSCLCFYVAIVASADGQEKHILPHGSAYSLAFSPDGKMLAVPYHGPRHHRVAVWDMATGKRVHDFKFRPLGATVLAWSRDGKQVIAGCTLPTDVNHVSNLTFWDITTGKQVRTQNVDGGGANRAISADGSLLVTVSGFPTKVAKVWNLKKNTATTLKGHKYHVSRAAFSADGKKVATSDGERIRIWELPSGKKLGSFEPKGGKADERLAFTPDGKSIVYENHPHGYIHFVDLRTGKRKSVVIRRRITRCFAVSPDGKMVATAATKEGAIDFWSIKTGKKLLSLAANQPLRGTEKMMFSPDGRWLAAASSRGVHIWEVPELMP